MDAMIEKNVLKNNYNPIALSALSALCVYTSAS
jgi:hypothetical protein